MDLFSPHLLVLIATLMGHVALGQAGGYTNFHCPSEPDAKLVVECAQDCKLQHGADTGYCGNVTVGDHNCYCDGRSGKVYQRSSLQCKEMNDGFRNLCTHDCVCNHGADGGHCMWDLGVCYCENWGKNPGNSGCPAKTGAEWLAIAKELSKPKQ